MLTGGNNNGGGTNELLTEEEKKNLLKAAHVDKNLANDTGMDIDKQLEQLEEKIAKAKQEVDKGDKKLLGAIDGKAS